MRAAGARLLTVALLLSGCRGTGNPRAAGAEPAAESTGIAIEGSEVELRMPRGPMVLSSSEMVAWVEDALRAVRTYFGRLPVERTTIEILRTESEKIDGGRTIGRGDRAWIRIDVGTRADSSDLARDWVLTHELVHTGLPELPRSNHWLEEGLATYVEPIARAQAGLESAGEVWRQLVEGLPKGLPEEGDQGLDHTPTWGRTYWGGALFCLVADVEMRERTMNRSGLQDALRALVADGRTILTLSPIESVLDRGDSAVGVPVLRAVYARHATHAETVDLPLLWKRLGITMRRGRVSFDETAPLSEVRRAITKANS